MAYLIAVCVLGVLFVIKMFILANSHRPIPSEGINMGPSKMEAQDPATVNNGKSSAAFGNPAPGAMKTDANVGSRLNPNFLTTGIMQAWSGQQDEHTATCNNALTYLKDTTNPSQAERVAKICSLREMDDAIHEAALVLARRAVESARPNALNPYYQMALGMAEYRARNYENAAVALREASRLGASNYYVSGTSAFYLAMCLARQDKQEEGRRLADAALKKMRPLPSDERNPLVGRVTLDDLVLWLAYKEALELFK